MLNDHQACLAHVRDAVTLEPSLRGAVVGTRELCERGLREGTTLERSA